MAPPEVTVEGLKELQTAFRKAGPDFAKAMSTRLREIAKMVQGTAREMAIAQGFSPPGRSGRGKGNLIKNIKASTARTTATIRETAVNERGYGYPAVFEFGHSKGGHRPFMYPAAEKDQAKAQAMIEEALDAVIDSNF